MFTRSIKIVIFQDLKSVVKNLTFILIVNE